MRTVLFSKFCCSFSAALFFLAPTGAPGAGVVTSPTEANLRTALAGGGTVTFATGGTINLSAVLEITNNTVMDAAGYTVTLSGSSVTGVFLVDTNVTFTLKNLTVANGQTNQGAGLCNAGGVVTISNVTFAGNLALGTNGATGALRSPGLPGQPAFGGGIYNAGTLTV